MDEGTQLQGYAGGWIFVRTCTNCGRFVKADKTVNVAAVYDRTQPIVDNATCKKCGRVSMPLIQGGE